MAEPEFDAFAYVEAAAAACGIAITDAQRPGVVRFLTLAHDMATELQVAPLSDDTMALAPVFCPGGRGRSVEKPHE